MSICSPYKYINVRARATLLTYISSVCSVLSFPFVTAIVANELLRGAVAKGDVHQQGCKNPGQLPDVWILLLAGCHILAPAIRAPGYKVVVLALVRPEHLHSLLVIFLPDKDFGGLVEYATGHFAVRFVVGNTLYSCFQKCGAEALGLNGRIARDAFYGHVLYEFILFIYVG